MILASCDKLAFLIKIVGYLFNIVQWAIPMFLIVLIVIDFFKTFMNPDDKAKKDVMTRTGKRLLYAIILFLIPILVKIVFRAVDKASPSGYGTNNSSTSWVSCFNKYF